MEQDSEFALAYARLAFSHTEAFWLNDLSPAHLDTAKVVVERALKLDPDLPEAHVALGHYYEACCGDYGRALRHLEMGYANRPGDAMTVMLIGNVHKRRGEWDEAIRFYEQAASLDGDLQDGEIVGIDRQRRDVNAVERRAIVNLQSAIGNGWTAAMSSPPTIKFILKSPITIGPSRSSSTRLSYTPPTSEAAAATARGASPWTLPAAPMWREALGP